MTANDAYILPPPRQPSVKVEGDARLFAVRRIFCVGRNYADHAREMGHDPNRELPFFFCAMLLTLGLGFCAFGLALFRAFAVLDVAGPGLATVATSAPFRAVMWSPSVL